MTGWDRQSAASTMCLDAASFHRFGWLLGTSGNLSVRRDAETFLITASGKDKGRLTPDDFLLCDLEGEPAEDTGNRPSAETSLHCAIYRRVSDAGAIYHVHEPYSALCSARDRAAGRTVFRELEMIKGLDVWDRDTVGVRIFENHREVSKIADEIDDWLSRTTPEVAAVMIGNHGFYAWGDTAFAAKRHVESLAYLYRYSWEWERR